MVLYNTKVSETVLTFLNDNFDQTARGTFKYPTILYRAALLQSKTVL